MGFTPAELNAMTFWEFQCATHAWRVAHGEKEPIAPPSDEAFLNWVTEWPTSRN